ncbi:galactose oxidase kelch beta-propeller [Pyrenophora seminiperda CCB06]|uniref:Galactose oxidase kelch beta-propeller n=1 Tax=Pyrenophora seminiperda CCB06 TaxID=1302712 RepID=A0A3M7LV65_9PLEO|nr:galactose oxidase kelch beta-propeller [Pyrenophora seminiperda CCB06]
MSSRKLLSPGRRIRSMLILPLSLIFTTAATSAAEMPYSPTRILQNNDSLYIFRPSSQSATQFQLDSVDISSELVASNLPYSTISSTLPFLDDNAPRAFTPILAPNGSLTVYAGDCTLGASGGQVWSFTSDGKGKGKGSWSKEQVSVVDSSHTSVMGANYLSGGMSFSSVVGGKAKNTGAYFFGGMCTDQIEPGSNWQSAANYSNLMVTLQPDGSANEPLHLKLDISSSRGPPVPEAGFTITGLSPTFSDRSDGTQIQQQNFLLIGGHTSAAFINMSQIALFSLPEQAWTFIGVEQPDKSRTDLAVRADAYTIDPRSGHTAVMTEDGKQIIIVGGWVGDINTPAEPSLAVLSIADGYGGDGSWQWKVPSTTGAGPPKGLGLYGHGAAMLPGGVMMITGGYTISSSNTRRARAPSANTNTATYFLNVTSSTWITNYIPPAGTASETADSGLLSTTAQKAGLGVGIGIGLAAVCGLFVFYIWYTRRLKKQRELREKQLQNMSYTTHRYSPEDYSPGFDGRATHSDALDCLPDPNGPYYFPPGTKGGQGWKASSRGDVERTGLLVEIPSPTRGLRRNLSGKQSYSTGRTRGPSGIHPIDELEEDAEHESGQENTCKTNQPGTAEAGSRSGTNILDNIPVLDPFITSRANAQRDLFSSPHGLSTIQSSGSNGNQGSGRISLNMAGRISPEKSTSERTDSSLSEASVHSWTSSHAGVVRSTSMHSVVMLDMAPTANPFKTPDASPTHEKVRRTFETGQVFCNDASEQTASIQLDGISRHTIPSSFSRLQAEGQALLGGNPERPRPDTSSSNSAHRHTGSSGSQTATATPTTSVPLDMAAIARPAPRERRMSWLGSVRRVLTRSASSAERRSLAATTTFHEPYRDDPISPVEKSLAAERKSFPAATTPPRRAASDASFWRNRRGQQDWLEDEQDSTWRRTAGDDWGAPEDIAMAERERARQEWRERGNLLVNINNGDRLPTPRTPISSDQLGVPPILDRPCTPASEADWDVEAAVERRVVQVMFTVPKSKLRVVNADIDGSSIMSVPTCDGEDRGVESNGSPSRVKDLAGRFEQLNSSPRTSPRPSPSNSIKSMKIRRNPSSASLARQPSVRSGGGVGSRLRPLKKSGDGVVGD